MKPWSLRSTCSRLRLKRSAWRRTSRGIAEGTARPRRSPGQAGTMKAGYSCASRERRPVRSDTLVRLYSHARTACVCGHQPLEVGANGVEPRRTLDDMEVEGRLARQRHLRDDAEQTEAGTRGRQELGILDVRYAQRLAVGGDEFQRAN